MRILALVAYPPRLDAHHGGARVASQLLAGLAKRHEVAVLALRGSDDPATDDELRRRADLVQEVPRPEFRMGRAGLLRALARGRPRWVAACHVPEFAERAREVATEWQPDIVQFHHHVMAQYDSAVSGVPSILVQHEPGTARAADDASTKRLLRRFAARLEEGAWRRFERKAMESVNAVVAFTEFDRRALQALVPGARVEVIPFGVPVPDRPLDPNGTASAPAVVFVGNFQHRPNVDAAVRLAREIHPRIRKAEPAALLILVGAAPPDEVLRYASETVEVAGSVADVTPYLDLATVVALPLRLGGGMRVKTLEALAYGKAVVASPLALEGIEVEDGEHVLVAEADEEFAAAVTRVLREPELRRRLARNARAWAEAQAGWPKRIAAHEQLCLSLLSNAPSSE